MPLAAYLALGDSMSIDRYPGLDHMARHGLGSPRPGLGAASLLAGNDDAVWPEFAGHDLARRHARIRCDLRAADGATTEDVLSGQLGDLHPRRRETGTTLVTLTAGGNDLLGLLGAGESQGERGVRATLANLAAIFDRVRAAVPGALVLAANVYDPTDGSGDLEGMRLAPRERQWLADYNAGVALRCREHGARLVDVHGHFLGHGVAVPPRERWYWTGSLIEPGWVGASEIRRLWLAALDEGERPGTAGRR